MNRKSIIIISILSVIIVFLVGGLFYQKNYYTKISSGNVWTSNDFIEDEYDCSFTKTYRVVNLLDGYISEVPEWSYVVVDQFQNMNIVSLRIPTELKSILEENKYYEFTYKIKGSGSIKTIEDINKNLILDDSPAKLKVSLDIKKTDKTGLDQIQDNICKAK